MAAVSLNLKNVRFDHWLDYIGTLVQVGYSIEWKLTSKSFQCFHSIFKSWTWVMNKQQKPYWPEGPVNRLGHCIANKSALIWNASEHFHTVNFCLLIGYHDHHHHQHHHRDWCIVRLYKWTFILWLAALNRVCTKHEPFGGWTNVGNGTGDQISLMVTSAMLSWRYHVQKSIDANRL